MCPKFVPGNQPTAKRDSSSRAASWSNACLDSRASPRTAASRAGNSSVKVATRLSPWTMSCRQLRPVNAPKRVRGRSARPRRRSSVDARPGGSRAHRRSSPIARPLHRVTGQVQVAPAQPQCRRSSSCGHDRSPDHTQGPIAVSENSEHQIRPSGRWTPVPGRVIEVGWGQDEVDGAAMQTPHHTPPFNYVGPMPHNVVAPSPVLGALGGVS